MGQELHSSNPSVHVYRYRRDTRLTYAALLVIVAIALTQAAWTHNTWTFVFFAVLTLLYVWIVGRFNRLQIIVAADGITYVAGSYILSAPWQDVVGIGKVLQPWYGWGDGLLLNHYEWRPSGFSGRFRRRVSGYIPIRFWTGGSSWEDGLEADLQSHAPWLFSPSPQSVAAAPPPMNAATE